MRSKVTTQPASEPVTLAEVKSSLRITNTAEDALLTQYITDARIWAERYTGRKFITQTITEYHDSMTDGVQGEWWSGRRMGPVDMISGARSLTLETLPIQSVTSFHTVGTDNSETLYASTNYYLDNYENDMRNRIILNTGSSLTGNYRASNNIKVVYVAGYGDNAADVPSSIRRAIIVYCGQLWSNRGVCDSTCAAGCGASNMLQPYKMESTNGI